jgi:hypothetical protein
VDGDPRSDDLLERCGRLFWCVNAAVAWTDGINDDVRAKTCSRIGSAGWKAARPMRKQVPVEDGAAAYFKVRARRANPIVTASGSRWDLVEYDGDRVELDGEHGIPQLPRSLGWQSRRGPHLVFRTPPGEAPMKVQVDPEGITVWSDGYLVAAPAWRREHGVVYELNGTLEPAQLPNELRALLLALGGERRTEMRRWFANGETIPEGHREVTVFWIAVDLLREGLDETVALNRTLEVAQNRCVPPLTPKRAATQFRGAVKFVAAHPTETEKARQRARRILIERRNGDMRTADEQSSSRPDRGAVSWEQPVPLATRPPVPPFPLETLPSWLARWASAVAREKGAAIDLTATQGLGVVSGGTSRIAQVSPRPGWYEPLNMYFATALDSGQRKTAAFKAAFRPVRTLERQRIREWEEASTIARLSGAIFDKRRKELINEAAGDDALDPEQLEQQMEELLTGLGPIEPSPRPRLLVEDVTPEALAQLLAEHGRIIAASDEGAAIFENLAGRYTHGSTSWDVFNKAHSAADLVVDRKSSGPVIVWDPSLTLVITTQPKVLRDLWGKPGTEGRGVLARPLYSLPAPVYETGRTPAADADVLSQFDARVRALFEDAPELALDEDGRPQPVTLRFDPAGEMVFEEYERELAQERRELGTSDEAEREAAYLGWLSKLAGQTARLAACLHAAAEWTSGSTVKTTIACDHVVAAVQLARYFRAHALAVFGLMGELPDQRRAHTILRWLRGRTNDELATLTVRDVHRSRGAGTTAEQVKAALALLEQHGYLQLERQQAGKLGGRPSERVHLNPALSDKPDWPDETDKTGETRRNGKGSVGSVRPVGTFANASSLAEHTDPDCRGTGSWLARDDVWRCANCQPPLWPAEIVEQTP